MLLPIFFICILTSANAEWLNKIIDEIPKLNPSANAEWLNKIIDEIPKLNPLEQIPDISGLLTSTIPEDAKLITMELINKYGYDGELHKVTTADGYILEIHRITGRANSTYSKMQKPIAFVMHGLLCSSVCWVFVGREKSLAFILADEGYDVWLGNARGNPSHTHTSQRIKPKDYWNFSWHEIGTRDLPAMIDHVVKTTGRDKMFYVGHSQGTTAFFVMATERPEYQSKIQEMYAMAPIAYCGRIKSPMMQIISQFSTLTEYFWNLIGMYKFNPHSDFVKAIQQLVCAEKAITQPVCANAMFLVTGFNAEQFDPALLPVILAHVPASTATKQIIHYGQLIKSGRMILPGNFKQYDLGLLVNKNSYGSYNSPNYDLKTIKTPVHLYYSENDWLANVKDVEKLYGELGNPSGKTLIADKKFNHIDYMWAKDAKKLVYDQILNDMKKSLHEVPISIPSN